MKVFIFTLLLVFALASPSNSQDIRATLRWRHLVFPIHISDQVIDGGTKIGLRVLDAVDGARVACDDEPECVQDIMAKAVKAEIDNLIDNPLFHELINQLGLKVERTTRRRNWLNI